MTPQLEGWGKNRLEAAEVIGLSERDGAKRSHRLFAMVLPRAARVKPEVPRLGPLCRSSPISTLSRSRFRRNRL